MGFYTYLTNNSTQPNGTAYVTEADTWSFVNGTWTNITSSVGTPPLARQQTAMSYDPNTLTPILFGGEGAPDDGTYNDTWSLGASGWQEINSNTTPPPLSGESLAFDSSAGLLLMYGGASPISPVISSSTWEFANGNWSELSPSTAPIACYGGMLADDPENGSLLLVEGATQRTYTVTEQSWLFSNNTWSELQPGSGAPPMGSASTVYDAALSEVVLVSPGAIEASYATESTWTYQSGNWTQVNSTLEPSSRTNPALVYDTADGYVLLFGGQGASSGLGLNDTWRYSAGNWTELSPTRSPPASGGGAITFDAATGYVVYVTGTDTGFETWEWSGGDWTNLNASLAWSVSGEGAPYPEMVYDSAGAYPLLIGGSTTSCPGGIADCLVTWTFVNSSWTDVTNSSGQAPPPLNGTSLAYDSGNNEVVLFGGACSTAGCPSTGVSNETWVFKGGTWALGQPPNSPSPRFDEAMTYDNPTNVVLLYGGLTTSNGTLGYLADTWTYNGSSWFQVLPGVSASQSDIDVGMRLTIQADASSIEGGASFSYIGLPEGCIGADSATFTCMPSLSGFYNITLVTQSGKSLRATATTSVRIAALPVISGFAASEASLQVGQTTTLSVTYSGGTPPLAFAYSNLPTGCSSTNSSSLICQPTAAGNYSVSVELTDALGRASNATVDVVVVSLTPCRRLHPGVGLHRFHSS